MDVLKNRYVQAILIGVKPCVVGIVLAMGIYMIGINCLFEESLQKVNIHAIIITAILGSTVVLYKYFAKKKMSPITMIVISSLLGMLVYSI